MAKKYVPNGAYLVCNKGLGYGKLKVTNHKNVSLYGKQSATEGDKIPMVNIPCLGICSITKTPCQPVPILWQGVQEGITIGPYRKLLEDSKLPCGIGGKIGIHFSVAAALAAIDANVSAMKSRQVKSLGAKVDDWFQKGFDAQEKANNKIGGIYGKYENFKLGVNEGIYGGVKGIGEGVLFLGEMSDKARGAALHAITHPTETAGKIKDAAVATKNTVSSTADWVTTDGNVEKVVKDFGQAHVNAYNWVTTPGNVQKAAGTALNNTGEALKDAKNWAVKQNPRDWGRYTGRGGFEAALMFTGVGEAKAVVSGAEAANVLAKTGEAANVLSKTAEVARLAKVAEEANAAAKAAEVANAAEKAKTARTLGEVVSASADDILKAAWEKKWREVFNEDRIEEAYQAYSKKKGKNARSKADWFKGKNGRGGYENTLKGKMGEYQADQFMASKGYKKLNHNGELIDPLSKAKGKGIDGVWHDPGPPPRYIISETKYGSGKLGKDQLSDKWINTNLGDAVSGKDQAAIGKLINKGQLEKQLLKVDDQGKVVTKIITKE
ncbi:hypothetical protein ASE74_15835 [Pedobacter sp. Leaf216]|uniref:PAAR-like protein n=1 Tax=Pedobacter sp. Leaf216 TaxID=1735684 RepID=UPI0006F7B05C|nr:PAAR-like protein [Pedobacter sp. Leaf216]KQM77869.1 hypothetical protein ASE74_15835 [Pedobacter sp. Leaf216]